MPNKDFEEEREKSLPLAAKAAMDEAALTEGKYSISVAATMEIVNGETVQVQVTVTNVKREMLKMFETSISEYL